MKTFIKTITVAACAVLASACGKDGGEISSVGFTIDCDGSTRAVAVTDGDETAIGSIQLFVFDSDGTYETGLTTSQTPKELEVRNGSKTFCALVNAPEVTVPVSLEGLLGTVSELQDNAPGKLVMYGSTRQEVDGDLTVHIMVRRLTAKVQIREIAVDFSYTTATSLTLNAIYLTNVVPAVTVGGTPSGNPADWFNQMGYASGPADAVLYDKVGTDIPNQSSYKTTHTFYACPNPTAEDVHGGASFTARFTRLVIDTDLGFYHVDLQDPGSNKAYIIDKVTIKGTGGSTPEEHVSRDNMEFTVSVVPWQSGPDISEII